jgi:hypothetical protein
MTNKMNNNDFFFAIDLIDDPIRTIAKFKEAGKFTF